MCFDSPHPSNFTQNANARVCSTKGLFILCIHYILAHRMIAGTLICKYTFVLYKDMTEQVVYVCVCTKKIQHCFIPMFFSEIVFLFFLHPSSCPNYCLLKS